MDEKTIIIDGSEGEGGGQVARTSVAFSAVTGRPVKIINIRAKRCNPGLRNQHVNGIKAVADIANARLEGCDIGSEEIEFVPSKIEAKDIDITVDTAGSISLILQAIMVPLLHVPGNVKIEIRGGATFGKWAPPIYYATEVLFPILKKMGYYLKLDIKKHGHYPKGMADVVLDVRKTERLRPLEIEDQGKLIEIRGISNASETLERTDVAKRQAESAKKYLENRFKVPVKIRTEYADTESTGSCIVLWAVFENTRLGADALGERGIRAEDVGINAARCLERIIDSGCAVDPYMSDQILPYLVFAEGRSKVKISEVTGHLKTNREIIRRFVDRDVSFEGGFICVD